MSIEVNRETKTSMKAKGLSIVDGNVVDDSGEIVNLVEVLSKVYGEMPFDLSTTKSIKESIDIEEELEATVDEDGNVIYE